jgi:hypothetical protein
MTFVSENGTNTRSYEDVRLPNDSVLAAAVRHSEHARGIVDWLLATVCILGIYMVMNSQLNHEIESSTLPPRKVEQEIKSTGQAVKMDIFSTRRTSEYEIWADLKDLLERKKPASGYCLIQASTSKFKKGDTVRRNKVQDLPNENVGLELACWTQTNKKAPSVHTGVGALLNLNLMGTGSSSHSNSEEEKASIIPLTIKAHEMSLDQKPIEAEGWFDTPLGRLRFDIKEQGWKQ